MNDNLEYIDDYFQKQLKESERLEFESRCLTDNAFAQEVALYVGTMGVLRENLLQAKKKQWNHSEIEQELPMEIKIPAAKRHHFSKWYALAAAACLAMLITYPLLTQDTMRELVHEYVENELTLSNTMDASRDSLQAGIAAYKQKDYRAAVNIFRPLYISSQGNEQILKYLGQSYLMERDYVNALSCFDTLSIRADLRSNPGIFLKAITLTERNALGDEQDAKRLFQKVVTEKLDGQKQAKIWLEKMD